ncbi:MAG: type II secretion system protein [Aquificae bacterium]|nr:type II secretion system protein [Aquificota bacterium]
MRRAFTIVEVLIAIAISLISLGAVIALYQVSSRVFWEIKKVSEAKENTRIGVAQLEWLFQRWGVGTPCCTQDCTQVVSCGDPGDFSYPPPSALCITIIEGDPCDEVWFYANLYGMGFVDRLINPTEVAVMSCRLSDDIAQNCYHIRRGGLWAPVDWDYASYPVPPIVAISNLSDSNLDCVDVSGTSNATMSRNVTILNGLYHGSDVFPLEGGDLLIRVPHRVRLFCKENPSDNNRLWLYMEAIDVAEEVMPDVPNCRSNPEDTDPSEGESPLVPVESFQVTLLENAIQVDVVYRGEEGETMRMVRVYGR